MVGPSQVKLIDRLRTVLRPSRVDLPPSLPHTRPQIPRGQPVRRAYPANHEPGGPLVPKSVGTTIRSGEPHRLCLRAASHADGL